MEALRGQEAAPTVELIRERISDLGEETRFRVPKEAPRDCLATEPTVEQTAAVSSASAVVSRSTTPKEVPLIRLGEP